MDIQIKPMTPARVDDYFKFFDEIAFADHPEWGCECYCCFFHVDSKTDWEARTGVENKAIARELILAGRFTGLLAYADDQPVAWCHYEKKSALPGISVFYPQFLEPEKASDETGSASEAEAVSEDASEDDSEDEPVAASEAGNIAAIVCFTVAQAWRRKGIAGQMLDITCSDLAGKGYTIAEAYPGKTSESDEHNYHGPLSLYLAHGFEVYREFDENTVVRKRI